MAAYKTQQKKILTEFLEKNHERAYSVEELWEEMAKVYGKEILPGKSTVYRLIQKMVEDGTVKRMAEERGRKFTYQIASGEHCAYHLHMKCVECGKLLHMDDDESVRIMAEVLRKNHFCVDEKQTVLVGRCEGCRV